MSGLSVEPEDGEAVLFGKSVSDLQSDIVIDEDSITGTLNYVTGYTGFSSLEEQQSGNYLALKVDVGEETGVTTTVEVVGGDKGPVTLDEDMNIVLLIKDSSTQDVKVTCPKGNEIKTITYDLSGLVQEPEE